MKDWLRALLSETILSAWWILSALSTFTTFFVPSLSGKPRLVSLTSAALGFALANFKVFQRQANSIASLQQAVVAHEAHVSQLRMAQDAGSRYILTPVGDARHADFNGAYLEFRLMIENSGRRNSTVNNYQVEIVELRQALPNLQPVEGHHNIQGRHCQYGMPLNILSRNGVIRVDAESATDHGALVFSFPGLNLQQFADAGMRMQGEERRFGPLHGRLTLTDTTNSSAMLEFELREG